jgi:hypothetical protein
MERERKKGRNGKRVGSRYRLVMRVLPFLLRSGLMRVLMGKRMRAFHHGVTAVRLTA